MQDDNEREAAAEAETAAERECREVWQYLTDHPDKCVRDWMRTKSGGLPLQFVRSSVRPVSDQNPPSAPSED